LGTSSGNLHAFVCQNQMCFRQVTEENKLYFLPSTPFLASLSVFQIVKNKHPQIENLEAITELKRRVRYDVNTFRNFLCCVAKRIKSFDSVVQMAAYCGEGDSSCDFVLIGVFPARRTALGP
jgi:hypothetical protein